MLRAPALCLAMLAGACANLDPLTRAESDRLEAFDFYWQRLADDYPLFGDQKIDWNELRARYRAAVPFAQRPHEFYHLLTGMLSELGDLHVSLRVPDERFAQDGVAPTSLLDVDGFELMPIEGRLHVVRWPAQQAPPLPDGVPPRAVYPELWRVNGFPVVLSLVGNLLLGPPESPVELQLRWRNGSLTRHVMHRPATGTAQQGSVLSHLAQKSLEASPRSVPWIEIAHFDDDASLAKVEAAVDGSSGADGIVIDLRRNLGGRYALAKGLGERFLREAVDLVLVPRHPTSTWFGLVKVEVFVNDPWRPRQPIVDAPVVLLTSAMTGSAAEHLARILQRYAGAVVVGERTAGAEAVLQDETGPDGGLLRFGSMRLVDRTGVGLQREGVVPDVSLRLTVADVERLGPTEAVADWERKLAAAAERVLAARRGAPSPAR
jgi:C-terminal processing protease CtpA/Prc